MRRSNTPSNLACTRRRPRLRRGAAGDALSFDRPSVDPGGDCDRCFMKRLALSIGGGILVGVTALCVLGLIGWAAGSVAGLSLSFHSGISGLWVVVLVAVLLGSGIAASWSAAHFYRRRSWTAPVGASIGLAPVMLLPFLRGPSPRFAWTGLIVAFVFAAVPGIIVASVTLAARGQDEK